MHTTINIVSDVFFLLIEFLMFCTDLYNSIGEPNTKK